VINLNALLRRRVEYYEYPWAIEGRLRSAQSRLRSLFQANDVGFIFSKSMPRSGHRFLTRMPHGLFRALEAGIGAANIGNEGAGARVRGFSHNRRLVTQFVIGSEGRGRCARGLPWATIAIRAPPPPQ
jgi:hypothetical protein